jgi:hypothetical protein
MNKEKLKSIIKEKLNDVDYRTRPCFIEDLAQSIIDYNNLIKYRNYDYDKEKQKWILKECH